MRIFLYLCTVNKEFHLEPRPSAYLGKVDMIKHGLSLSKQRDLLISQVRGIPSTTNENDFQISVDYVFARNCWVTVFPSQYYPWFCEKTLDYFRAFAISLDAYFILTAKNGVVVAQFWLSVS